MPNQLARFHILCHIATGVSLVVAFFGGFLLFYKFFYASFFVAFSAFIIGMVPGFFLMLFAEGLFYIYRHYKAQEKTNELLTELIDLVKQEQTQLIDNKAMQTIKENDAV